jgi:hypothetical protein
VDLFIYPFLFNFECFLSLVTATYKKCQNLWVLGSTSELVNLTILKKISLKKKYLRGALKSAHYLSHEKNNYLVWMPLGNFTDIKKNSQLYKGKRKNASKTEASIKHT